jgi:hypothetical protein
MRCSASGREAVHRCSGTVTKAVRVKIPGLQRIIPLRFMLRCARDTPFKLTPVKDICGPHQRAR